ncbi:Hsp20/alpha crystallin family protein [Halobium salinum]|uniref:Hsp20/alpha crystallin family protein n=1 Tax=Halobium salinum TaxID=1364940 RepID=A0ABD5PGQ6_9EURY|nr:Hsp20 family protein [Halobium salinum]
MTSLKELGESARNAVLEQVGRGMSRVQERTPLRHDVLETDEEFLVVFDAPGAARSDIQVRFVENTVEVRVDRFRDFYDDFEMRFPGRGLSLHGEAELPEGVLVRPADSTATLTKRGELHVRVPKDERGRTVSVEDEDEVEPESIELDTEPAESPDAGGDGVDDTDFGGDADAVDTDGSVDTEDGDDETGAGGDTAIDGKDS